MRARLKDDQRLCDVLIPTDYGFGTHRVPLERNYLEVYLRDNVELVGVRDNPIARIVPEGIELADGTVHELDVIVLATGFDAGTGSLTRIDVRGRGGAQPHRGLGPRHPHDDGPAACTATRTCSPPRCRSRPRPRCAT